MRVRAQVPQLTPELPMTFRLTSEGNKVIQLHESVVFSSLTQYDSLFSFIVQETAIRTYISWGAPANSRHSANIKGHFGLKGCVLLGSYY